MGSVLGSILDPAADKFLMTTMVVTLAMKGLLPREHHMRRPPRIAQLIIVCPPVPLAVLIIGRDVALTISAFYFRYASLPPPVNRRSRARPKSSQEDRTDPARILTENLHTVLGFLDPVSRG